MNISLTPPRTLTFWVAVALAALALLGRITPLPLFSMYSFGILLVAFIILALGVLIRDW